METPLNVCGECVSVTVARKMDTSASIVNSVICSVITDSSLFDWSERSKLAKEQAQIFLQETDEKCVQSFDQFCGALTKTVEKNLFACVSAGCACCSKFVQREKLPSSKDNDSL